MNYTSITLGELLSSQNETIKRNATSILKQLQKGKGKVKSKKEEEEDRYFCNNPDCEDYAEITIWTTEEYRKKGGPVCHLCGEDLVYIA